MNNAPFSLTFGKEPNNYIERYEETESLIADLSRDTPVFYAHLITGSRGSGKTVFMSNVAKMFADKGDWLVVDPIAKDDILASVAAQIYEKGKIKHFFLEAEWSFSFQGFGISIKGRNPVSSITTLIDKMFLHLSKKKKKVLITIDEVDNSETMKNFLTAYQYFLRQGYNVRLLMTGLYENVSRLQEEKSLTFLYRCPTIQLGPLNIGAISAKYMELLQIDEDTALSLAKETKGFAFAYQLLGYLFYNEKEKAITPSLLAKYDEFLAKYVYEKIYADLSGNEKKIVHSFRTMKTVPVSEICSRCGFSNKYLGVYRSRLIKKGVIVSPSNGYLAFALPRFDKFLSYQDEDLMI